MKVKFGNTWLASGGLEGTSGANWNGAQVNDEAAFFRAASKGFYPRGGRATTFGFRVAKPFSSEAQALSFCALHFGQLPQQADLIVAEENGTYSVLLATAVLDSVRVFEIKGVSAGVEYSFRGGLFTGEDVPDPAVDDGDGNDLMKIGVINLTTGDESRTVSFGTGFGAEPRSVKAIIEAPGDSDAVAVVGVRGVSSSGFTVVFAAAIPDASYKLRWEATL